MQAALAIHHLEVTFGHTQAVKSISFEIAPGKLTALVGESGSGKSVTALSILKLLPSTAQCRGEILFNNQDKTENLLSLSTKAIAGIRGNRISMIFQEPMTSLNPLLTCGSQVIEAIRQHQKITKQKAGQQTIELFRKVGFDDPASVMKRYPHEISGGQKQRVMIVMAICCKPDLLIADEPTTALDVTVQKNILLLIKKLQEQNNMAVLLITHDLGVVADIADNIILMYQGKIVEQGVAKEVLQNPSHPYTRALLACRPGANQKQFRLPIISDFLEKLIPYEPIPKPLTQIQEKTELLVENLKVYFPIQKNFFGKPQSFFKAVDDVSFTVQKNEILGLVGESGCGKTTLGRTILQLQQATSGNIYLKGRNVQELNTEEKKIFRKELQIVFQDPYGSLNPRLTIGDAIEEPLKVHGIYNNANQRKERVIELFEQVNLHPDFVNRYPHQFSGGQRQRICIARALALNPSFLVFDESVSALDVSVQAQVLNLITDIKSSLQLSAIFISHDLSVVHYISDRIMVMQKGKIVEAGNADDIFYRPAQSYTRELINSIMH
ncbi:MAG: ABC transporter ATP-binding protein [Niastella sp.]|nr:ABC transporter ATP-binding protein [Niastella sp.]